MSALRINGGRVVTPDGTREADIVVSDGVIAAVGPPSGGGDLDARGCFVLPGGVDPHTHLLVDLARGRGVSTVPSPPWTRSCRGCRRRGSFD